MGHYNDRLHAHSIPRDAEVLKNTISRWFCALLVLVACSGCIEKSTVIKIKKDGSGVIHVRNHVQDASIKIGKAKPDKVRGLPNPAELERIAKRMGGVTLVSADETQNRNGWHGYELVFKFDDINQVVLSDSQIAPQTPKDASSVDQDAQGDSYRFAMKGNVLEIRHDGDRSSATPKEQLGAVDPFAKEPPASGTFGEEMMTQILAQSLTDMRIGLFVQIDGELASTNAAIQDNNLVTLMSLQVGKVLADPNARRRLQELEKLNASEGRAGLKSLVGQVEGLAYDVQDPIVITYK